MRSKSDYDLPVRNPSPQNIYASQIMSQGGYEKMNNVPENIRKYIKPSSKSSLSSYNYDRIVTRNFSQGSLKPLRYQDVAKQGYSVTGAPVADVHEPVDYLAEYYSHPHYISAMEQLSSAKSQLIPLKVNQQGLSVAR